MIINLSKILASLLHGPKFIYSSKRLKIMHLANHISSRLFSRYSTKILFHPALAILFQSNL